MMIYGVAGFLLILMVYTARELEEHRMQKRWTHVVVHGVILLVSMAGCVWAGWRAVAEW